MSWVRSHWIMVAVAGGLAAVYLIAKLRGGSAGAASSYLPSSVSPSSLAPDGSGSVSSSGGDLPIPTLAGGDGSQTPAGAGSGYTTTTGGAGSGWVNPPTEPGSVSPTPWANPPTEPGSTAPSSWVNPPISPGSVPSNPPPPSQQPIHPGVQM